MKKNPEHHVTTHVSNPNDGQATGGGTEILKGLSARWSPLYPGREREARAI